MINPYQRQIEKYLFDILKEKYPNNKQIIERMTHYLVTERDAKEFLEFIVNIYEAGFIGASKQYKEHFEKLGYRISIKSSK